MPEPIEDIIVVLPRINGSVLERGDKVVWGITGRSVASALLPRGGNLSEQLSLAEDPVDADELGDGVVAARLIPDLHSIPRLWKIDGYAKVCNAIQSDFAVTPGENYFAFPYDWRRDNRVAARKLAKDSHEWLAAWRTKSPHGKLILVCRSMGGLVERYFLEVMEGWKDTRALITFSRPYRGPSTRWIRWTTACGKGRSTSIA